MAPRLKVFSWSDGFHSWTVAASSRPKALKAWNVQQDLFKSGLAHEIAEGAERDAALEAPGAVIKTGMAIDLGMIDGQRPDAAQTKRRKVKARAAELQTEIDALDGALGEQVEKIRAERAALDRKLADLQAVAKNKRAALIKKAEGAV